MKIIYMLDRNSYGYSGNRLSYFFCHYIECYLASYSEAYSLSALFSVIVMQSLATWQQYHNRILVDCSVVYSRLFITPCTGWTTNHCTLIACGFSWSNIHNLSANHSNSYLIMVSWVNPASKGCREGGGGGGATPENPPSPLPPQINLWTSHQIPQQPADHDFTRIIIVVYGHGNHHPFP